MCKGRGYMGNFCTFLSILLESKTALKKILEKNRKDWQPPPLKKKKLTRMKEKRKKTQIADFRNEMRYTTTNLTEIKMIIRNYYEQL